MRSRPDRRAALLAALLALTAATWLVAPGAAAAPVDVVTVGVPGADGRVSLVADVRPPNPAAAPRTFAVVAGNARLPTQAVPVVSDQLSLGLVVDASAAGASALQEGVSGLANFVLQVPSGARTTVVADTKPAAVAGPLQMGATDALRALDAIRPEGERDTEGALKLAARQLPVSPTGSRVLVLYTGASDAGGELATELGRRLAETRTLLAVVTPAGQHTYWSQAVAATGGVVVPARAGATMAAFDDLADILRGRYLLTFPAPPVRPARVSVQVGTNAGTLTASTVVPAGVAGADPGGTGAGGPDAAAGDQSAAPEGRFGVRPSLFWGLLLAVGALAAWVAFVVFARRAWSQRHARREVRYQPLETLLDDAWERDASVEPAGATRTALGEASQLERAVYAWAGFSPTQPARPAESPEPDEPAEPLVVIRPAEPPADWARPEPAEGTPGDRTPGDGSTAEEAEPRPRPEPGPTEPEPSEPESAREPEPATAAGEPERAEPVGERDLVEPELVEPELVEPELVEPELVEPAGEHEPTGLEPVREPERMEPAGEPRPGSAREAAASTAGLPRRQPGSSGVAERAIGSVGATERELGANPARRLRSAAAILAVQQRRARAVGAATRAAAEAATTPPPDPRTGQPKGEGEDRAPDQKD
jgi:hypothetical protein